MFLFPFYSKIFLKTSSGTSLVGFLGTGIAEVVDSSPPCGGGVPLGGVVI